MTIADKLPEKIKDAMKKGDRIRLDTLKMLSSALSYEKINLQHDLSEQEELKIIKSEAKKRRDAIEAYIKAKRQELADKEQKELDILKEFLPEELSNEKLEEIIDSVIKKLNAASMADMGKVMGETIKEVKGQADGSRISALVKQKLS